MLGEDNFFSDNLSDVLYSTSEGYKCKNETCLAHPISMDNGWADNDESIASRRQEDFADMFLNWTLGQFTPYKKKYGFDTSNEKGYLRDQFMNGGAYYPNYGMTNWLR